MLASLANPQRIKANHRRRRRVASARQHYNYFRDYEPVTGRYVESDPLGLMGGVSTYQYVHGVPINLRDPFGLGGPFGGYTFNEAQAIEAQQEVDQEESNLAPHGGGAGFSGTAEASTLFAGQVSVAGAFLPNDVGLVGSEGVSNSALGLYTGGGPFIFFTNATTRKQMSGCAQTTSYNTPFGSLQTTTSGDTWVLSLGVGRSKGFSVSSYSTYTAPLN